MIPPVAEASAMGIVVSDASEHLEAVVSGRLRKALLLTFIILAVELTGAILSDSLALFSDAGHVTTDILALGLAWFAVEQTKRPADDKRSFGYHRAGILAATTNGATLIVLVFVIAYEAVERLTHPEPVQGGIVIISAFVGVAVNGYVAFSMRGQGKNLEHTSRPSPRAGRSRSIGRGDHRRRRDPCLPAGPSSIRLFRY